MIRSALLPLTLALGLVLSAPSHALTAADGVPADPTASQVYWDGQDALQKADWSKALERFTTLEKELRAREPASADTAVYWQVYVLVQAHRIGEAKGTADRLKRDFPQSRWNTEAASLLARSDGKLAQAVAGDARVGSGHPANGGHGREEESDDLAEAAVEALMQMPEDKALPLLKRVVAGKYALRTRQRALFVLAQMDGERGLDVVAEIASNNSEDALRREAIRMLGISGESRGEEKLLAIYAGSKSLEDRKEVIHAWLAADRKDLVLKAARTETTAELRNEAIHSLGAMDAAPELGELLKSTSDPKQQEEIVNALGIAGDSKLLEAIATQPGNLKTREAALHALGVADAGDALVRVYKRGDLPPELRDAVLQGLMVSGDDDRLIEIYKATTSKEEKRSILRLLSAMGSEHALTVIEGELKQ